MTTLAVSPASSSVPQESLGKSSASVEQLLQWIAHHPHYRDLVSPKPAPSRLRRWLMAARHHLVAHGHEMHGTAYVTPTTRRDSDAVARVITTSNLVDGVGNFNLFLFASGIASPLGWISAAALTGILLKFDQELFTLVARGRRKGRHIAYTAALIGLLPFSLLKTIGTGVGVEVMQNQPALAQRHATALVTESLQQERQQITRIAQVDPTYATVKEQCRTGQAQLARLSHADPRWQSLQVELYGEWSQRLRDWRRTAQATPPPVCVQQRLIEADQRSRTDVARQRLAGIERQRIATGNDLLFLRQHFPERYGMAFLPNGEFRSSVALVAEGMGSTYVKLCQGQWSQLGLSIYMLLISLLSSLTACMMVLLHPHRPGVAQSWDEDLRRERDRWLAEQLRALQSTAPVTGGQI